MHHFLTTQGMDKQTALKLFEQTSRYLSEDGTLITSPSERVLTGKTLINLFYEPSTRTRCSFELAAKRLGAHVCNVAAKHSSHVKGESIFDTVNTLAAMSPDFLIIRHPESGMPAQLAEHIHNNVHVINAGDGISQHPSQGLLDMYMLYKKCKALETLKVAILGDIAHSRVVRSQIPLFRMFGIKDIRFVAPQYFQPKRESWCADINQYNDLKAGLTDADVVITLRIQNERLSASEHVDGKQYGQRFGLTPDTIKAAKQNVLIMHPGPVNRGVEIDSTLVDGLQSLIIQQVTYGVATRMALLFMLQN